MGGQVLRAADRVATPWKNGGGKTATVAVFPEGAGLADFDWRISIARVEGDGPFSAFPGIDRTLTILSGGSMMLKDRVLRPDSAPFSFDGTEPVTAMVAGGPIYDLNVMTRRGRFTHRVERVMAPLRLSPVGDLRLLLALGDGIDGMAHWDAMVLTAGQGEDVTGHGAALLVTIRCA